MNHEAVKLHRRDIAEKLLQTEIEKLPSYDRQIVERFINGHRVARDVMSEFEEQLTFGQRIADRVAAFGGSWTFIFIFLGLLMIWMIFNTYVLIARAFDPYPYILLNLILSSVAALQAPVIMMSQNRQDQKDRLRSELDFNVNRRAELEIQGLAHKLNLLGEKLGDVEELLRHGNGQNRA